MVLIGEHFLTKIFIFVQFSYDPGIQPAYFRKIVQTLEILKTKIEKEIVSFE